MIPRRERSFMTERDAVVEISKREETGGYRAAVRDLRTNDHIDVTAIGNDGGPETRASYRHVCKVRLPADETPRVRYEPERQQVVVRAGDRTYYRHELPAQSR
jgi:hypothetical protein